MYTNQELGNELKKQLIEPIDYIMISEWAENIHYTYCLELSEETYDIIETLVVMMEGPEFELSKEQLELLADKLINSKI